MTTYPEPTLIFENPELTVRALSVSEMDNSVYLITMRATGEQVLIDPAAEAEELYAFTLDALLNDCPQLELTDSEDRRVRVMEKEEDFNSLKPRAIGLTGILVHSFFESLWEEPYMMALFFAVAGMLIYAGFLRRKEETA